MKGKVTGIIVVLGVLSAFLFLKRTAQQEQKNESIVEQIVASEEMMESQRKFLKKLAETFAVSAQPAEFYADMFADEFRGNNVAERVSAETLVAGLNSKIQWDVSEEESYPKGQGWEPYAKAVSAAAIYDFTQIYMIAGSYQQDGTFLAKMGVKGRIQNEGSWLGFRGKQKVTWKQNSEGKWQLLHWKITSFETFDAAIRVFENVTADLIKDENLLAEVLASKHEEFFVNGYTGKKTTMRKDQAHLSSYITSDALARHPSLAVVDYDGDGWDDLYMTVRLGRNVLLRNCGDGRFEDATERAGLSVNGFSPSALFADFDNDGDPDLFLGRSLLPSQYFENQNGVFIDKSGAMFEGPMPYNVTSLSVVDYNQDGLLDFYVSTYGLLGKGTLNTIEKNRPFMQPKKHEEFAHRLKRSHRYLDLAGPPNRLYVNKGKAGFAIAPENSALELFYNTLQASWSDFDDDGDQDLYVANDFAPDVLIRNDGKDGHGHVQFVDVTEKVGHPTMVGFGMGVSWGDYNNDSKQDLYVSNMFSKAGMRITAQVPGLDPRIRQSAEGSRLFSYDGERFELKSLPKKGGLDVNKSGWSWGGQFIDIDNDGWLDLYATNGHYTAHPDITNEADG